MIEHLSYSSVQTLLGCGRAWRYQYIQKVPMPTSPELVFGSAWHGTMEGYLAAKTAGRPNPDLADLWAEQWKKHAERQPADWGTNDPENYRTEGPRLLGHPEVQAGIDRLQVGVDAEGPKIERKVTLNVPGVAVPVIGYIDFIAADGVPCDIKTSAKPWSLDKAQNELQPLFYLAALNQAGIRVPDLAFRHVVFTKTEPPTACRCWSIGTRSPSGSGCSA